MSALKSAGIQHSREIQPPPHHGQRDAPGGCCEAPGHSSEDSAKGFLTDCQNLPSHFTNNKVKSREGVCFPKGTLLRAGMLGHKGLAAQPRAEQRLIHKPSPGGRFWSLGKQQHAPPCRCLQLVRPFIITHLRAGLAMPGSKGLSSTSETLHEPVPGGSGWASLLTSRIPTRLREAGSLAQGHTPHRRQS